MFCASLGFGSITQYWLMAVPYTCTLPAVTFGWGSSPWTEYELIIHILSGQALIWHEKYWSGQVTNLHMPRQLSCRDMCKIVIWWDNNIKNWNKNNFVKILVMSSWPVNVMGLWSLLLLLDDSLMPWEHGHSTCHKVSGWKITIILLWWYLGKLSGYWNWWYLIPYWILYSLSNFRTNFTRLQVEGTWYLAKMRDLRLGPQISCWFKSPLLTPETWHLSWCQEDSKGTQMVYLVGWE